MEIRRITVAKMYIKIAATSFNFFIRNTDATKIEIARKYLSAIQSWVGTFVPMPGKIFMPLYESVWKKSIIATEKEAIPKKTKYELLFIFLVFHAKTKMQMDTRILIVSTDVWNSK